MLAGRASDGAFVGVPASAGLGQSNENEPLQNQNEDRLKPGLQQNPKPELQQNRIQIVEHLKAELERVADLKAQAEMQAEAGAIEHWATGIQKLVDDMAKRFSLNWRPMPRGQAENLVRRFMEANEVSASEIVGRELSIVVMNMVADEKERMEKEKAAGVV